MRSSCMVFLIYVLNTFSIGRLMVGDLSLVHANIFQTNMEILPTRLLLVLS